jgi:hypothetical protein
VPELPFIDPAAQLPDDGAAQLSAKEDKANKGVANGYAPLDANAKVPTANLPDQATLDAEVDAKITTHNSATTSVHGIADTANLVLTNDARLTNNRAPTSHTHSIADVTNLQTSLNERARVFSALSPSGFPIGGNAPTETWLYLATLTGTFYRWSGASYVEISPAGRTLNENISFTNSSFSDLTGLVQRTRADQLDWYDGLPAGWNTPASAIARREAPAFNVFAYREGSTPDYAANVSVLSAYNPALGGVASQPLSTAFTQTIGPFSSDANNVTITYRWIEKTSPLGFQDSTLGAALYRGASLLDHGTHTTSAPYSLSAGSVTVGQSLTIAFWAVLGAPLLAEVTIQNHQNKTWLFPTNLPNGISGLMTGEIYKDTNGFLKIA